MATNEQPGQAGSEPNGSACPLCGSRPARKAGQNAADGAKDFSEHHRCAPRVQTGTRR